MHSVDKGEVARYLAIPHLIKKGMIVSIPTTENSSYDLIADWNSKLYRIQVKKLIPQDNGTLRLSASTQQYKNKKYSNEQYSSVDIDWLLGVDIDNNKFYLLDYTTGKFDGFTGFHLRLDPAKNNNSARVRFAKDYEF